MGLGLRHDYGNPRGGISKRDPRGDSDYVCVLTYNLVLCLYLVCVERNSVSVLLTF